jgi:hypothetical protein
LRFLWRGKSSYFLVFERCIVFDLAGISYVTQRFPVSLFLAFFSLEGCIFPDRSSSLISVSLNSIISKTCTSIFFYLILFFVRGIMAGAGRDSGRKGSGSCIKNLL